MRKDEKKAIGVIHLTLKGEDHPVPVYRHTVQVSEVPRLHSNWEREFFGILINPLNEDALLSSNQIRIIEFGETWGETPYPIKIDRNGSEFHLRSDSRERDIE